VAPIEDEAGTDISAVIAVGAIRGSQNRVHPMPAFIAQREAPGALRRLTGVTGQAIAAQIRIWMGMTIQLQKTGDAGG